MISLIYAEVWLRTGVTSTDFATYPDAKQTIDSSNITFTGLSFITGDAGANQRGITFDGTDFWFADWIGTDLWQVAVNGDPIANFNISSIGSADGCCWNGSRIFIVNGSNIWSAPRDGGAQINEFSISGTVNTGKSICWDGEFFWITSGDDKVVYKYSAAGVYTGVSFSVNAEINILTGIEWDGTHFWVVDDDASIIIYQYDAAGVYTGVNFDVTAQTNAVEDITAFGNTLVVINRSTRFANQFSGVLVVGLPSEKFDVSTGIPIYVRIK